jgi:replication factor A1
MKISEIKAGEGKINIEAAVVDKTDSRDINKYNKNLKVATATIKDESGKIKLSLWNTEIEKVNVGDKIKVTNGYASEFKGEKQLTAGKFGKIEVVGKASEEEMQPQESEESGEEAIKTNIAPGQLTGEGVIGEGDESDSDEEW